ncbi:AAA domain-containing protein [Salinigranum sp. GCM10025319]|uniref:AAA domain-containing protein n=1 Tax=Salinigranum sp. GCM10025319 TaxID=3252687 RepID=UPI00361E6DA4
MSSQKSFRCSECRRRRSNRTRRRESPPVCADCLALRPDGGDRADGLTDEDPDGRFWDGVSTDGIDRSWRDGRPDRSTDSADDADPLGNGDDLADIDQWIAELQGLEDGNGLIDLAAATIEPLPIRDPDTPTVVDRARSGEPMPVRARSDGDDGDDPATGENPSGNGVVSPYSAERTARVLQDLVQAQARARSETGAGALFVGLCTLRWTDGERGEEFRSPLFLLPAELVKDSDRSADSPGYRLEPSPTDIRLNPALRERLGRDYGLALPPDDAVSLSVLPGWVRAVEDVLAGGDDEHEDGGESEFDGWEIVDELLVGAFDVAGADLATDLAANREAVARHPLVRAIHGDASALDEPPETPAADELDETVPASDVYQVLDADASQQEAIEAAKAGMDFVLQGPPGTGKSQTISNVIAEKLARGERVLFVSPKQAALETVERRLDDVGLGRFCLRTGDAATRQRARENLATEFDADPIRPPDGRDDVTSEFESVRGRLNEYGEILPYSPEGQETTVYEALGRVSINADAPSIDLVIDDPFSIDDRQIEELIETLEALADYDRQIDRYGSHPWRLAALERRDADAVEAVLESAETAVETVAEIADEIGDRLGLSVDTISDFEQAATLVDLLADRPDVPLEYGFFVASFYEHEERLDALVDLETRIGERRRTLMDRYDESLYEEDGAELAAELDEYGRLKRLRPSYRSLRARLSDRTVDGYDPDHDDLRADAETLAELQRLRAERSEFEEFRSHLGGLYDGPDSDWDLIREVREWVAAFQSLNRLETGNLRRKLVDGSFDRLDSEFPERVAEAATAFEAARADLAQVADLDAFTTERRAVSSSPIRSFGREIREFRESTSIEGWVGFARRLVEARESALLDRYLDRFLETGHGADALVPAFERTFFDEWLNAAAGRTGLGSFSAAELDRTLSVFRWLDRQQLPYAAVAVQHAVTRDRPKLTLERAESADQVRLRRAVGDDDGDDDRPPASLPNLTRDAADLIGRLTPCLMTSPAEVPRYVGSEAEFDAVVFDEASRLPLREAVSSLVRGEQTIVVGDAEQLPPTTTTRVVAGSDTVADGHASDGRSDGSADLDGGPARLDGEGATDDSADRDGDPADGAADEGTDDDGTGTIADRGADSGTPHETDANGGRSLLAASSAVLPEKQLRWHHRSSTPALVDFSNRAYYDGRLLTLPDNRTDDARGVGVEFVDDGRYDSERRVNEPEARRVVDLIETHAETRPDDSLGVVTLAEAQAEAVRDEIRRRVGSSPALASLVDDDDPLDGFFVKPLAYVQGDVRDRIVLDIGYGPDRLDDEVDGGLGPLAREDGHRWLNVAVTRARDHLTVVSSVRSADFGPVEDRPGVRDLQRYLAYAERGGRTERANPDTTSTADTDAASTTDAEPEPMAETEATRLDTFERAVRSALTERGHEVDTRFAGTGYSVDLAVRHPDDPDAYVLGIECDGPAYRAADTARDRDRTRPAALEARGWAIHRVWSPAWTTARPERLKRLTDRIDSLLATPMGAGGGGMTVGAGTPDVETVEPEPMDPVEASDYLDAIVDYREPSGVSERWGEFADASIRLVEDTLEEIVKSHGPIERTVAYRQVAGSWDSPRIDGDARRRLNTAAAHLDRADRIVREGDFMWPPNTDRILVRRHTEGATRPVDHVSLAELAKAAYVLLAEGGAMTESDLVLETATLFGYDEIGDRTDERIERAVSQLIDVDAVETDGDRLVSRPVRIDDLLLPSSLSE